VRAFEAILNLVASLAWPAVAVLALIQFKGPLSGLLERLKSAALPGGVNLDFDEQLLDAKLLAKDIEDNPDQRSEEHKRIPQTEANKRLIELNLRPSPSGLNFGEYRDIANNDPILALASLRTEIDAMIKNLADGFKIDVGGIGSSEGCWRNYIGKELFTRDSSISVEG
jgi:hypothetical protein